MKRKIKFRGKSINTNEWVYGYTHSIRGITYIIDAKGQKIQVDADTVGQYTSICSKNGKEIYEGDIIEHYSLESYCINPDCEPHIRGYGQCIHKNTNEVEFRDGVFGIWDEEYDFMRSLSDCGFHDIDINEMKEQCENDAYFDTNGYDIDETLIGVKIVGNIYDNKNFFDR